jgi:NMD protein affecting ribosome stability and mRNA decay
LSAPLTSLLSVEMKSHTPHRHRAVVTHVLRQRAGVPYEIERKVCSSCARVLEERPLKRAAA